MNAREFLRTIWICEPPKGNIEVCHVTEAMEEYAKYRMNFELKKWRFLKMICPKCNNQFDIYNAVIAEDKENEGKWICPECKVPLNDSDAAPTLRDKIKRAITDIIGEDRPFMVVPDIAEEITRNIMGIVEQQSPKNPPLTPPKRGIIEQNTQGACEYCGTPKNSPNFAYHICVSSKKKKEVVISVIGGVVNVDQSPPGIDVKVRDYDIEGCSEDDLTRDDEGNLCYESTYGYYVGDDDDGDPS